VVVRDGMKGTHGNGQGYGDFGSWLDLLKNHIGALPEPEMVPETKPEPEPALGPKLEPEQPVGTVIKTPPE
jgi:hypothetical protein